MRFQRLKMYLVLDAIFYIGLESYNDSAADLKQRFREMAHVMKPMPARIAFED